MLDFLGGFVGMQLTGMTAYMFSHTIPLFTRALSLFHFWLPVNINYVYGLSDEKPQEWMPAPAYLAVLMLGLPICFFLPSHLILRTLFRSTSPKRKRGETFHPITPRRAG